MPSVRSISFTFSEYKVSEVSDPDIQELIEAAITASEKAYAPYSKFRVGVGLRLESGRVITGSNVENAAFPSGICAERTALSYAVTNYPLDPPAIMAIAAMNEGGITAECVSPCGNCRQVIAEIEEKTGKPIRLILTGRDRVRIIDSGSQLLPLQFSMRDLTPDHP